jgi:tetratricopeptide (TPR) repeat protein
VAGAVLLTVAAGIGWRAWRAARSQPVQARRIAILAIDNQTGDSRLNWAGGAIAEAALLELGQGGQTTVFQVRDAGDAAVRRATHLVYGRIEPEWAGDAGQAKGAKPGTRSTTWITYSFSLEDVSRHAVARRVRETGPVLKAATALAALVAPEAGVRSTRAAGVGNDQALEFFAARKYGDCTGVDPQAFWCWERWATSTFEAGKKEEALSILARGRQQGTRIPEFARAQLDLVDASIRGDSGLRMAALRRMVRAEPSNAAALAELASALMANRQFAEAESLYGTALKRDSGQAEFWNLLAYAQAGQSHFDEARKSLAEYDRLAPGGPNPADSRGEIEWMAGNLSEAAKWFQESYRRDARFNAGVALEKAALSRYLAGDAHGAEELVNKYLAGRQEAGDGLAAFHRARWQFLWGDAARGESLLESLVERGGPDAPLAALRLMLAALRDNDLATARKWAMTVRKVASKPGSSPYIERVASALADGDLSTLQDPALRSELAALRLTLRGDFAPAVAAWDESLRIPHGSNDTFAREMKAWCLLRSGRGAESASLVKNGWPLLDSDDRLLFDFLVYPNLLFVRAAAAEARGDAPEARRLYDIYLRYSGPAKDRFGQMAKAEATARL